MLQIKFDWIRVPEKIDHDSSVELDQVLEERALLVDGVERLRLDLGESHHLRRDDAQARDSMHAKLRIDDGFGGPTVAFFRFEGKYSTKPDKVRSLVPINGWVKTDNRMKFTFDLWMRMIQLSPELFARYARARGAHIYAEIAGYGSTCEAFHRVRMSDSPEEPARAIGLAMKQAGIAPNDVHYVNLHGTSTQLNDRIETQALKLALGEQARIVGAINALGRHAAGGWRGDIFDGVGCVEAFRRRGIALSGRRLLLLGAGGAGSAWTDSTRSVSIAWRAASAGVAARRAPVAFASVL